MTFVGKTRFRSAGLAALAACAAVALAAPSVSGAVPADRWITVTEGSAGTDLKAKDEAVAEALRKAVKQVCGTFIQAQTKTENYQVIYDKIIADTTGYVVEYKVLNTRVADGITWATVRALVSTRRFSLKWSAIAHTVLRENNPRLLLAIAEATVWLNGLPQYDLDGIGTVQSKIEEFLLSKNIQLVDKEVAEGVKKRDLILAEEKGDTAKIAAVSAKFQAEVTVVGKASARFTRRVVVGGQTLFQYTATMTAKAIQVDSGGVLVSKTFGPITVTSTQGRSEVRALTKLAADVGPELLEAIAKAWAKRQNVFRTVPIVVAGLSFSQWGQMEKELKGLRGVEALRLREITNDLAQIDVEYRYSNQDLAKRLVELKSVRLEVTEISATRIKLKVVAPATAPQ